MSIRAESKKILSYLIEKAIEKGSLEDGAFFDDYPTVAAATGVQNVSYCCICCEYLEQHKYIRLTYVGGRMVFVITVQGIDFLETS